MKPDYKCLSGQGADICSRVLYMSKKITVEGILEYLDTLKLHFELREYVSRFGEYYNEAVVFLPQGSYMVGMIIEQYVFNPATWYTEDEVRLKVFELESRAIKILEKYG